RRSSPVERILRMSSWLTASVFAAILFVDGLVVLDWIRFASAPPTPADLSRLGDRGLREELVTNYRQLLDLAIYRAVCLIEVVVANVLFPLLAFAAGLRFTRSARVRGS